MRTTLATLALLLTACSSAEWTPPPGEPSLPLPAAPAKPPSFARVRDRIVDEWLATDPSWARELGMHQYDGKLADYRLSALEARIGWLEGTLETLNDIDASTLSADDALDRAILISRAELEHFDLSERQVHRTSPDYYKELFDVSIYIDFEYAPLAERARKLVEHEEAALTQTEHVFANLSPVLSRPVAETAVKIFQGYAEYLRGDVVKVVSSVPDQALQARFRAANERLASAASEVAQKLQSEYLPRADQSHVLGRERYLRFVQAQEGRLYDLGEFKRMAEDNLAENKRAYQELARTVKPSRPKAAELMREATRQMEAARQFVVDKRIATLPTEDRCVVKESPPYMRWNSAFLNMPGPFDSAKQAFYYITLPDPAWPKQEQEDYVPQFGTLLATTVHEVYPGHFQQGLWINRAPTRVQKMAASYSYVEGWAHYTEHMMIEQGFGADDAQNRLGQLADALLRNCRFIVSIGIHAEGMSLEEAERRFVDDCFQDRPTARQQAVRGTFDPGYFAYTLGKLQILEVRAEAKKRLGDKFDLQRFHDAFMSHGSPPVALIRERVLADVAH